MKNIWPQPQYPSMKAVSQSSQSETFKKGHKINTDTFYRKNANFLSISVLYKKFQDFEFKMNKLEF